MRFTEKTMAKINERLDEKKRANPIEGNHIGLGVKLSEGLNGSIAIKDCVSVCSIEDLSRTIVELTMLKEAIEEETGIVL